MSKMSEETKERLKKIPKARCEKCNHLGCYTNPLWKCFECKKKFCTDHIWGGQINDQMKENEEIRDICEKCRLKYGYHLLG